MSHPTPSYLVKCITGQHFTGIKLTNVLYTGMSNLYLGKVTQKKVILLEARILRVNQFDRPAYSFNSSLFHLNHLDAKVRYIFAGLAK